MVEIKSPDRWTSADHPHPRGSLRRMSTQQASSNAPSSPKEERMDVFATYASLCARSDAPAPRQCIAQHDRTKVGAGTKIELSFPVELPTTDAVLFEWEFSVSDRDILVGIEFLESGSVRRETITHPRLCLASEGTITDSFPITRQGQFIVTFDNTFSYFNSKVVSASGYTTATTPLAAPGVTRFWRVNVHGWIYSPRVTSVRRRMLLGLLRRAFGLDSQSEQSANFNDRLRMFITNNLEGHKVTVSVGPLSSFSESSSIEPTQVQVVAAYNGHFRATVEIPEDQLLSEPLRCDIFPDDIAPYIDAPVTVLQSRGLSVISDVDDTVKESEVTLGKRRVFENIFLRDAAAVDTMSEFYASLASQGVAFHYVSNTPWQLHGMLESFFKKHSFPSATLHLKSFNLSDQTRSALLQPPEISKRSAIFSLLRDFPDRRFILVGDSGERDPELYASICTHFPSQVALVIIRHVQPTARLVRRHSSSGTRSSTALADSKSTPALPVHPMSDTEEDDQPEPSIELADSLDTISISASEAAIDGMTSSQANTREQLDVRMRLAYAHLHVHWVIVEDGVEAIKSEEIQSVVSENFAIVNQKE